MHARRCRCRGCPHCLPARTSRLPPRSPPPRLLPRLQGVSVPSKQPTVPPSNFGFVENAERLNSRAAMVGARLYLAHCSALSCPAPPLQPRFACLSLAAPPP